MYVFFFLTVALYITKWQICILILRQQCYQVGIRKIRGPAGRACWLRAPPSGGRENFPRGARERSKARESSGSRGATQPLAGITVIDKYFENRCLAFCN